MNHSIKPTRHIEQTATLEDQGLERISKEFREECANEVFGHIKDLDELWDAYREAIREEELGGVSSDFEARRLFLAEKIGRLKFSREDVPSRLAEELTDEFENTFQNNFRPVSREKDQEKQLSEVIGYYFYDENRLRNFYSCLGGEYDNALGVLHNKLRDNIEIEEQETTERKSLEADSELDPEMVFGLSNSLSNSLSLGSSTEETQKKDKEGSFDFDVSKIIHASALNSPSPKVGITRERDKVRQYLSRETREEVSLPERIKRIIREHYPEYFTETDHAF